MSLNCSTTAHLDQNQLSKICQQRLKRTSRGFYTSDTCFIFKRRQLQQEQLQRCTSNTSTAVSEVSWLQRKCVSLQVCVCVDHLPFSAVLQSVAYLIFGLKQDVLELGGARPADCQLVLEVADTIHLHVGGRVCSHCTDKDKCLKSCIQQM